MEAVGEASPDFSGYYRLAAQAMLQMAMTERGLRTTNSLERLIEEARRRTKVISSMPDERAGLSLIHALLLDVSRRWHGLRMVPGDLKKLNVLRAEVVPLAASA